MADDEKAIQPAEAEPEATPKETRERQKLVRAERHEVFVGPLPHPDILAKYDQVIPNGAERILAMAEQQQAHRIHLERTVIESDVKRADRGLILGFIIALVLGIGGVFLVANGRSLDGLAIIFVPLASLVGVFVYAQKTRREERAERSKNITSRKSENDKRAAYR